MTMLHLILLSIIHITAAEIVLNNDGGYEGIVVKIEDTVDEVECSNILQGFQVSYYTLLLYGLPSIC